ncbi:MAG TPA: hypothetical protein VGI39_38255 [Polyangiaceae bacterium]|jgi:hypothetical protein
MRRSLLSFFWCVGLAAAVACGGSNGGSGFGGDDGGSGSGSGSGAGTGSGTGSGSGSGTGSGNGGSIGGGIADGGPPGSDGCSDAAKLVYVLSEENDLYSFNPPAKTFTKIGALKCSAQGMTPNSMAVSRDAVAWVNYTSADDSMGAIFKVSTTDASCQSTNVSLQQGWTRLGMGFSTDSATSTSETLFVAATGNGINIPLPPIPGFDAGFPGGGGAQGLGKLDLTSQTLTPIGNFTGSLAGQSAELTGTGDGRLFGFFTTTPVVVAEIDKTSGATSNPAQLSAVETPTAWAFSFWGGDFYLYTSPGTPNRTSNVTHYSPSNNMVDTAYMTNVGFNIVGAGVSTCAPTTAPPK